MIPLHPPRAVVALARRLEKAGFETWCVGGAVRDALLGNRNLDWDLATAARPEQVRMIFRRTVPVGVEFGTVGVFDDDGIMHEVTTFRRDIQTDGRHAVVEFGASLEEDLARRDFTINAIAYSPTREEVRDPFDGRGDLERRLVRAVGIPDERMREDRLRALRAIRFASRFGFDIEPATWRAVEASAPHLGRLSPERVKQELEKTMEQVARPGEAISLWQSSGALRALIPPLDTITPMALAMLDALPPPRSSSDDARTRDRVAALFSELGGRQAARVMRQLRFSNQQIAWAEGVIEGLDAIRGPVLSALAGDEPVDDRQLRRWVASVGRTRVRYVFRLLGAERRARERLSKPAPPATRLACLYRRALRSAFGDALELSDLAVSGDDLRAAGIPAGPTLGRILHELRERVIADPTLNTVGSLTAIALQLHEQERATDSRR